MIQPTHAQLEIQRPVPELRARALAAVHKVRVEDSESSGRTLQRYMEGQRELMRRALGKAFPESVDEMIVHDIVDLRTCMAEWANLVWWMHTIPGYAGERLHVAMEQSPGCYAVGLIMQESHRRNANGVAQRFGPLHALGAFIEAVESNDPAQLPDSPNREVLRCRVTDAPDLATLYTLANLRMSTWQYRRA